MMNKSFILWILALLVVIAPQLSLADKRAPLKGKKLVAGELIIKFKGASGSGSATKFMGKMQDQGVLLQKSFPALNMHQMKVGGTEEQVLQYIEDLKQNPNVEFAEPNYVIEKFDDETEDSAPLTKEQSMSAMEDQSSVQASGTGFQSYNGATYSQSAAQTNMPLAWSKLSQSTQAIERPIVAIIDTGVDYTHPVFVLSNSVWSNPNEVADGIDNDNNGYIDDVRGWNFYARNNNPMDDDNHGTHVAGIVVGAGLDIFDDPLVESPIRVMPLKFLGADGSGSTSDAIAAIYYAVNNGAKIINCSWGGSSYSQSLHEAMTYAYNHKVTVVAAAGNYGKNNDSTPIYPATYKVPSLISVAATSSTDLLASFSNFGFSTVDVASPGVSILSTIPHNYYRYMSGTSMAAPLVAGLAALALRESPDLNGYQIKNIIMNSAVLKQSLVQKVTSQARVDGEQTVVAAKVAQAASYQPDYSPRAPAGEASSAAASSGGGGGCGLVSTQIARSVFMQGGGSSGSPPPAMMMVGISLLPLIVWMALRRRSETQVEATEGETSKHQRRFERFVFESEVKIRSGDKELTGQLKTISVGGASFATETLLEKGGVVKIQITSPDGREQVEVEGHVVWNASNAAYGVQFSPTKQSILHSISNWTKNLVGA